MNIVHLLGIRYDKYIMPAKNTINISLTDEQVKYVNELVASGEYASKSEVFRDVLKKQYQHHKFREFIKKEIAQGEASGSVPFDAERLTKRLYKVVDEQNAKKTAVQSQNC